MLKQQTKMTAIYKRLSRDDGGDAESNSIVTQSHMLRRYAKENGLVVYDEYTDDGISGTTLVGVRLRNCPLLSFERYTA